MGADLLILADDTDVNDVNGTTELTPWDKAKKHRVIAVLPSDPNCVGYVDMGAWEACPGDVDDDGAVGLPDLSILLSCFGSTNCNTGCCRADMNCDDDVDLPDLSFLLTRFGATCGAQTPCSGAGGGSFAAGGGGEGAADSGGGGDAARDDGSGGDEVPPSNDPFAQWLRNATVDELLEWHRAGMPH